MDNEERPYAIRNLPDGTSVAFYQTTSSTHIWDATTGSRVCIGTIREGENPDQVIQRIQMADSKT